MQASEVASLVEGRHSWLLTRLSDHGRITTNAAAAQLGVSVDTVRRDLRDLHDRGLLRRVHGGAVPLSPLAESYTGRTADHSPERALLASAVVSRLKPGQVIGLDAGTTTAEIASQIPQSLDITIVTNNPAAAVALADHKRASVVLLGGEVDLRWMATTGPTTVDELRGFQLDLAVIGACSFDAAAGASTRSRTERATKRAFVAAAAETVVPLESDKLGTVAPFHVAATADIEIVVVEAAVDADVMKRLKAAGTNLASI